MLSIAALNGCSAQIAKRLVALDVLGDVELRYVAIYYLFGETIISTDPRVPGHDDPFLIQHGQRTILRVRTPQGSMHQGTASEQYSPAR